LLLNAQLKIETIKALTFCENCEQQFETIKFGKTCPHCGSEKTYLLQGREFNIKEIEVY
jgi:hydrogenase nickel incorporation protein HypA/HybF